MVGGAGRLSSVIAFFEWFEKWSDAQVVQGESPHVTVFVPEGIDDEDFQGVVVFSDGVIFMYEGGKKSYAVEDQKYVSIGSGSDYALAAMDAGATAEEAVKVAIGRDVYTGGKIFIEELDEEPDEFTKEVADKMTKEELVKFLFGEEEVTQEQKDKYIWESELVSLDREGNVTLKYKVNEKHKIFETNIVDVGFKNGVAREYKPYKDFLKKINRDQLVLIMIDIGEPPTKEDTKNTMFEFILCDLGLMFSAEKGNLNENQK